MTRKTLAAGCVAIASAALVLVGIAPATGAGAVLARYPYLGDLTATSVAVTWATTAADTSPGVVTVGTGTSCTQTVVPAQHAATTYTAFGESAPYYQHVVQLTGLAPSTTYCYRVYSGTTTPGTDMLGVQPRFPTTFTTVPSTGAASTFSFDVLGDFGETSLSNTAPLATYNQYQSALDTQIAASATEAGNPALFAVSTGDIAYNDGSTTNYGDLNHAADRTGGAAEQSNVFDGRYWAKAGSSLPLYSVVGNHGRNGNFFSTWPAATNVAASGGTYTPSLSYPAVDGIAAGKYPSDWYAFTVGGVRFYVLDADWTDVSQSTGLGTGCGAKTCPSYQVDRDEHWQQSSAEYSWLAGDLQKDITARGPSALRLAFFHYPLRVDQNNYTTQQDPYLQNSAANPNGGANSLEALLARDNVNLVFNGHAHMYERNVAPPGGVPNYVTGGGGGVPTNVAPACSATDAYARGWDPTHAAGSSCGRPSDGATAKPSAVAQVYHFLKVTVSGTDVKVDPTDSTGAVFDPMTYHFAPDTTAPTTPATPSVARGTGAASANVTVTLGAGSSDDVGVVSYDVYRDGNIVATVPAASKTWTDFSVPAGTHTWTVAARDQRGNQSTRSAASAPITFPDTTPPTPPTLSAASGPTGEIDLSWSGATDDVGVTGYNVYRDGGTTPAAADVHATAWADIGLAPGSTHTYTVVAHDTAGNNSAPSNVASATVANTVPIGPPAGLTAQQSATAGQVAITWSPPDAGTATSYAVYRDGQALSSGPTTSYTDRSAPDSVAVTYRVVASDAADNTSSASVTITPDWTAPSAPGQVSAAATGVSTAKISWTAATDTVGVTAYTITRSAPGEANSTVATVSGGTTAVTDTTGTRGTTYTYSVVAADAQGNTSARSTAAVTLPVFTEDFESGSIAPPRWTTPTAGLTTQQSTVHAGNWAAEETSTGTTTWSSAQLPATYRALHVSAWVYLKQRSTSAGLFKLRSASGAYIAYLYVNAGGFLSVRNDAGLVTHAGSATVSTGHWHQVEIGVDTNPGGQITIWAALDGTRVTLGTPVTSTETLGNNPIGQLTLGDDVAGRSYDIAIDDVWADTSV
ncbi:MAG TPA: fibronectin type III domain-containing protein [Mycobacteriales bacterium]